MTAIQIETAITILYDNASSQCHLFWVAFFLAILHLTLSVFSFTYVCP